MNSLDEAYLLTHQTVDMIEKSGIKVDRVPPRSRNNKRLVEKYNRPDRLPPEKWFHVTFYPKSPKEAETVFDAAQEMAKYGISFDTGGCRGERDWELDWSFRVNDGPDDDMIKARSEVEEIITTEVCSQCLKP